MAQAPKKPSELDNEDRTKSLALIGAGTDLVEFDESELAGLTNLGYSDKADDSLVPLVSLVQENSAEAKKNHPKYIAGVEPGDLIIRSLKKIIKVNGDGLELPVIPCGFTHYWVEWEGQPGEGTVVNQYPFDDRPAEAIEQPDPQNDDRKIWVMKNGNRLQDTRYWYCQIFVDGAWMPVVIPMGGTNHTVSRGWNAVQKGKVIPAGDRPKAPSWYFVYGFKTFYNSRGTQSWFTYLISELGWVQNKQLRDDCRKINEALMAGEIAANTSEMGGQSQVDHEKSAV